MERVFEDDSYATSCEATVVAADGDGIRLDRTVFYAMGGGQPGDSGVLHLADGGEIQIVDTRKGAAADEIVHIVADGAARFRALPLSRHGHQYRKTYIVVGLPLGDICT